MRNFIMVQWEPCDDNDHEPDISLEKEDDLVKQGHLERIQECYGKLAAARTTPAPALSTAGAADATADDGDRCCICLSTVGELECLGCCKGYCHRGCYQRWHETAGQMKDYVEGVSCPYCRTVRIE